MEREAFDRLVAAHPRAWLLALLHRVAERIAKREAKFRKLAEVSLEAQPPPEPMYDDDEGFYEWYQPDAGAGDSRRGGAAAAGGGAAPRQKKKDPMIWRIVHARE
jgi:hypothetical protein